jgi:hypothetical protein
MSDSETAADAPLGEEAEPRPRWLVRAAPEPDAPHERDRAGAQTGMMIALLGGGLFWGGVAAAVVWFLRR